MYITNLKYLYKNVEYLMQILQNITVNIYSVSSPVKAWNLLGFFFFRIKLFKILRVLGLYYGICIAIIVGVLI